MREYLERSIGLFLDQHRIFHEQVRTVMSGNPFQAMAKVAEQNLAMWQDLLSNTQPRQGRPEAAPEPADDDSVSQKKTGA